MISELWNRFPRLLENNINGLLNGATPNRMKAFQLYKSCKNEGLWKDGFGEFSDLLDSYFRKPAHQRTKAALDIYLKKPMDYPLFREFYLDFRTADIDQKSVFEVASWAHNLMRLQRKDSGAVTSIDVMNRTLHTITTPTFYAKADNIQFDDFCGAWRKVVFKLYGQKYDHELNLLIEELDQINIELKLTEQETSESGFTPPVPLTKTELDWTLAVQSAALDGKPAPSFPSSDGPQKRLLMELERVVILYQLVQVSSLQELIQHRSNIRTTLIDRCEIVLGKKAAA